MKSNKIYTHNHNVPNQLAKIAQWHEDRNLIKGATNWTQYIKLMEEMIELFATLNPELEPTEIGSVLRGLIRDLEVKGRIKQAPVGKDIRDDVGDINVVLINLLEREGYSMQECLETAWDDIKDRKGQMIDGIFVKEADLEK